MRETIGPSVARPPALRRSTWLGLGLGVGLGLGLELRQRCLAQCGDESGGRVREARREGGTVVDPLCVASVAHLVGLESKLGLGSKLGAGSDS